jgi:hypothetical protein
MLFYLRHLFVAFVLLCTTHLYAQKRALFLGNSYTAVNNLPQLVAGLSTAAGKNLVVDNYCPGGFTYSNHSFNNNSQAKIRQSNWDYVILQEQSQIPSITHYRYNEMYPAAQRLRDSIMKYNPCATIITYMTWGRRNGGQQCGGGFCSPAFTSFNHMQDSLESAYEEVSDLITSQCAPAGMVWKKILGETSMVLHAGDNSHPLITGSYAAACAIFSSIWKERCAGLSFVSSLSAANASYIQRASDSVVFQSNSNWNLNIYKPAAAFSFLQLAMNVSFLNESISARTLSYAWDFGDDSVSVETNPVHQYRAAGVYPVTLVASDCYGSDTIRKTIIIEALPQENKAVLIYPNPVRDRLMISLPANAVISDIRIMDVLGRIVLNIPSVVTSINLSGISAGTYFLQFKLDGKLQHHVIFKY